MAERPAQTLQRFSFTIANGAELDLPLDADQLVITKLDGADVIELYINGGPRGDCFKGLDVRGDLRALRFANNSGSSVTLEFATAAGLLITDRRLAVLGGTVETDAVSPGTLRTTADETVAATSTAEVLAADTDRAEAIIKNLDSSNAVRVGDGDVGASRGHHLGPGDSVVLTTTAAISVHNPAGSGVDVSLVETVR